MNKLDPLDFHRALNLKLAIAFEKADPRENILQVQLRALMETFRADVGGILLRPDLESPDAKLAHVVDINHRMPKNVKPGTIFKNDRETPPYLRDYWKLHGNTAFSPTDDVGVDVWMPIHSPSQTRGAFFVDDTSRAMDLSHLMTDLTRVSLSFSMQYEAVIRAREQSRSVAKMLGLRVVQGGEGGRNDDPQKQPNRANG